MEYIINQTDKSIIYEGTPVYLPKKEFRIIEFLQTNPNRLIDRKEILKNVWDEDVVVLDRTVDVLIRRLRKRFPNIPIVTRKCYGYMWKENVENNQNFPL
jgi:two-component system alkaline phosphatase synthesis response regulator PhoP